MKRLTDADLADRLRAEGKPVDFKVRRAKPRTGPSESEMQQNVIRWWASVCGPEYNVDERLLMAFPLQGVRTARNGARMKREGMRRGTPDLFLAIPMTLNHGLWIEMKAKGGVVSREQEMVIGCLGGQSYVTAVCWSDTAAIATIREYLTLK